MVHYGKNIPVNDEYVGHYGATLITLCIYMYTSTGTDVILSIIIKHIHLFYILFSITYKS